MQGVAQILEAINEPLFTREETEYIYKKGLVVKEIKDTTSIAPVHIAGLITLMIIVKLMEEGWRLGDIATDAGKSIIERIFDAVVKGIRWLEPEKGSDYRERERRANTQSVKYYQYLKQRNAGLTDLAWEQWYLLNP